MQDVGRIGEVLETIVCPACHGRLRLESASAAFMEGVIRCAACGRSYPIEDGIPVLLLERAKTEL